MTRGQPYRRVAANWAQAEPSAARRGAASGGDPSKWRAHDSTYTDFDDGAPKHQGNAFETRPRYTHFISENESKSGRI